MGTFGPQHLVGTLTAGEHWVCFGMGVNVVEGPKRSQEGSEEPQLEPGKTSRPRLIIIITIIIIQSIPGRMLCPALLLRSQIPVGEQQHGSSDTN